jgi:hypothetical protein
MTVCLLKDQLSLKATTLVPFVQLNAGDRGPWRAMTVCLLKDQLSLKATTLVPFVQLNAGDSGPTDPTIL